MNKVELQNLVGGQLQEKFEHAFERVIENLQDPNTSFKVKRGITIKLSFTQNENRDDVSVSAQVVEKLAPQQDMSTKFYIGKDLRTKFYIGKDLRTGEVYAEEYGKQIRGQMSLNLNDSKAEKQTEVVDGTVVDTETGEILSGKNENVVDFRKAAK